MERLIAEKFNIKILGMDYVDRYGINKCIEMALDAIDEKNNRDYYISFDIDALDRFEAPSTGISLAGGLTLREGIRIIERIFETGRLTGLDCVEFCPNIGDARDVKTTIDSVIQLISAASGNKRSGNAPITQHDIPKN
ncbi:arginase [Contarinia nasturtii]|uniref:arginase n=1 Tax=Contarinia nasturtii TaxID=265458 RepID=UPI0012D48B82|nr:arginase [Contarinia nasturtii]